MRLLDGLFSRPMNQSERQDDGVSRTVNRAILAKRSGGRGGKVYLAPGEEAPEGVEVVTTPRGARYYINPKAGAQGVREMRPVRGARSLSDITKEHVSELKGIGEAGGHAGINGGVTMVAEMKEGVLPKRPGFNDTRVLYKHNAGEVAGEVLAYQLGEILEPGWAPEVVEKDLGKGPGHLMAWVDNFGMAGATAHRPGNGGNWNEQKVRDAARMWVLDSLTGNSDRHEGNYIEDNADGGHIRPIDNGYAFRYTPGQFNDRDFDYQAEQAGKLDVYWDEVGIAGRKIRDNAAKIAGLYREAAERMKRLGGRPEKITDSDMTQEEKVRGFGEKVAGEYDRRKDEIERKKRARELGKEFWVQGREFKHHGLDFRVVEYYADGRVKVKEVGARARQAQVLDQDRANRWLEQEIERVPDKKDWKVRGEATPEPDRPPAPPESKAPEAVDVGRAVGLEGHKGRWAIQEVVGNEARIRGEGDFGPGQWVDVNLLRMPPPREKAPGKIDRFGIKPGDRVNWEGENLKFKRRGKNGDFVFERQAGGEKRIPQAAVWRDFNEAGGEPERAGLDVKPGDHIDFKHPRIPFRKLRVDRVVHDGGRWMPGGYVDLRQAGKRGGKVYRIPLPEFNQLWREQRPKTKPPKAEKPARAPRDRNAPRQRGGKIGEVVNVRGAGPHKVVGFRGGGERRVQPVTVGGQHPEPVAPRWVGQGDLTTDKPIARVNPGEKPKAGEDVLADRAAAKTGNVIHIPGFGDKPLKVRQTRHGGDGKYLKVADPAGFLNGGKPFWIRPNGDVVGLEEGKRLGLEETRPRAGKTPGGRKVGAPKRTPELRGGMKIRIPGGGLNGEVRDRNVEVLGRKSGMPGRWRIKVEGEDFPRVIAGDRLREKMRDVAAQGKHPVVAWAKRGKE